MTLIQSDLGMHPLSPAIYCQSLVAGQDMKKEWLPSLKPDKLTCIETRDNSNLSNQRHAPCLQNYTLSSTFLRVRDPTN